MTIYKLSADMAGFDFTPDGDAPKNAVLVFGFFDGVHLGHAALIDAAVQYAKARSAPVCVWTFDSLPQKAERVITPTSERLSTLASLGVDYAVTERFDDIRTLTPDDFFDGLVRSFSPCAVFCGYNFRYGNGAAGTASTLAARASKYGIHPFVLPPFCVTLDGKEVPLSSTVVRRLLSDGETQKANTLLVRPFSLTGEVIHGNTLGREIGFPTLNQRFPPDKLVPAHGAYVSAVTIDGVRRASVSNVGSRPTVNGEKNDITLETNVFGYSGDAYGKTVTVELYKLIRHEKKFASLDELSAQIDSDIAEAKKYHSLYPNPKQENDDVT